LGWEHTPNSVLNGLAVRKPPFSRIPAMVK